MSKSTFGRYLSLDQLERYLDVPAEELEAVLQPQEGLGCSTADHELFLTTFGIVHDLFAHATCWHLLGNGHVYTLGEDVCLKLLTRRPQPEYL